MARRPARTAGDWALARAMFGLTRIVGTLPIDRALDLAHAIGVRLGPRTARHALVRDNLAFALPELPEAERARIGREMWGHQARLVVEAAYPAKLFDLGADGTGGGRVDLRSAIDFADRAARGVPTVFFTGHTGCFEFLPAICRTMGYPMATLFRAPNNRFVAARLLAQREGLNGLLVPARRGAAARLANELAEGRGAGVLVDQKFRGGPLVPFFGRPAPTNALVARLARLTGGEVVPARCVRLPGNRYRLDVEAPVMLPLAVDGTVDAAAALPLVNAKVEGWVREHPEQWMWFHRRWG